MAITVRPSVPTSHASESEHRRQLANTVNLLNQTTPDSSDTEAELEAGVRIISRAYPPGDPRRIKPVVNGEVKINIPSDVETLQDAIDLFPLRVPGVTTVLNIESGHALTAGIIVTNGDYGHIVIRHEADGDTPGSVPVQLASSFKGVSNDFPGISEAGISDMNLIVGRQARMPMLECLIDMGSPRGDGQRWGHGVYLLLSHMTIAEYCGVKNAGMTGISAQASRVVAYRSIWDGAGSEGIRIQQASNATFQWAHANECQQDPISTATNAAVYAGRSSCLQFQNGEAKDSHRWAIDNHRAWLNAQEAILTGATGRAANCQDGGHLILKDADLSGAGEHGLRVVAGVWVSANGADLSDCGSASVRVDSGGNLIDLCNATTNSSASAGVPHIDDVLNVSAFNTPTFRGIVFANES